MRFPPLIPGRLLRRYKRFLAEVVLASGEIVTASVANTGAMLGLAEPGTEVFLSAAAAGSKLPYRWLLARPGGNLVCVDTSIPNRVVRAALEARAIPELAGYLELVPEMPLGENSRADFCLRVHEQNMTARCWVEVKAVSLQRGGVGCFPDCRTLRGARHLVELMGRVRSGDRAVQLFFVQRGDCAAVRPADDLDPVYASTLHEAAGCGVELLALRANVSKRGIEIERPIPVEL